MPAAVIFSVFGVCLCLYGIYYAVVALSKKKRLSTGTVC